MLAMVKIFIVFTIISIIVMPAVSTAGSREILAMELYRRGARMELSGDFGGALRLWIYARKLDPLNRLFKREVSWMKGYISMMVEQKSKDAAFDIQHGRNLRALATLTRLRETVNGVSKEVFEEIEMLISTIKSEEM